MKEPRLHRGIRSRFRWDDPLLVVCSLVFEFLALGLGLVWTLAHLGPEFLSVWYLAGASTFAFLGAYLALAARRGSHRARSIAIGFPGLLAVSAPLILFNLGVSSGLPNSSRLSKLGDQFSRDLAQEDKFLPETCSRLPRTHRAQTP